MWPEAVPAGTDELDLVRGDWHRVFGRWHRTVRCFVDVIPLAYDGPAYERLHNYLAYQVMLGAAQHCHEFGGDWEKCLFAVITTRMKVILSAYMVKNFPDDSSTVRAFGKLTDDDRLLTIYYDHHRHSANDRLLGPEGGVFTNADLCRFFGFDSEDALRQAASRSRRRFENLIGTYEKAGQPTSQVHL
jgi:hypothetical protein